MPDGDVIRGFKKGQTKTWLIFLTEKHGLYYLAMQTLNVMNFNYYYTIMPTLFLNVFKHGFFSPLSIMWFTPLVLNIPFNLYWYTPACICSHHQFDPFSIICSYHSILRCSIAFVLHNKNISILSFPFCFSFSHHTISSNSQAHLQSIPHSCSLGIVQ